MLRSHTQLSADMIFAQFLHECIVSVRHDIVKTYTGADKHLFHIGNPAQLSKQLHIVAVVNLEIGTRLREKALLVGAYALGKLLVT